MALAAPVDIVIPSNNGPYFEPYDTGAVGNPYGISYDNGGNTAVGGGGSGISTSSSTSGDRGSTSSTTTRTGDSSRVTASDNATPDVVNAVSDALAATPFQYLFNLALQRAQQPTGAAIVIPPTTGGGGSALNIKTIVLVAVIGLGVWYVIRKYA